MLASGVGLPEAAAITLLDGLARYGTAMVMFGVVKLGYGVKADMRSSLALFVSADGSSALPSRVPVVAFPKTLATPPNMETTHEED